MLRWHVKAQIVGFIAISLIGISYVAFNYVGLGSALFGATGCKVGANFPDSGGIFTNAEVTYRGVTIGKVGELHLQDYQDPLGNTVRGVRVDLQINDCKKANVPMSAQPFVADRSAVGEQYVNLEPPNGDGPYVQDGSVFPASGQVPIATQVLLKNLDDLVTHIDSDKLNTVITELGNAFNGRGPDLQSLIDSGNQLIAAAQANLPATLKLIDNGTTVLQTQLDVGSSFKSWARDLNLLTAQLKASDPDITSLLTDGPSELEVVRKLLNDNRDDLHVVLANLLTTNQIVKARIKGVETILLLYPAAVAGGFTVAPGDNTAHFGLVINNNDPQVCVQGYEGTNRRQPSQTSPMGTNTNAQCTLPASSASQIRGMARVPGGDPVTTAGGDKVYPRAVPEVGSWVPVGGTMNASTLADDSWLGLLTSGLR
jgi:phospholipid/cholesterol/gamma-HCH transport system substrate-binding protein